MTRTPYVVPIARAHAIWGLRQITYVMARQMAKTQGVIFAEIGRRLDDCPTPIMYVGTTELFIRDKVEPKIVHLLQSTPSLNRKTSWGHGSSKYSKVVAGVRLKLAWAGSDSMLKGDENCLVLVDEVDGVEAERPRASEGTVVAMAEATTSTYPDAIMSLTSTPTLGLAVAYRHDTGLWHWAEPEDPAEIGSAIWRYWLQGSRHEWAWPCPHCQVYFIPRSMLIRPVENVTPLEAERAGCLVCPVCGAEIRDPKRGTMNDRGIMVAPGQRPLDYDPAWGCLTDGGPGPMIDLGAGDIQRLPWGTAWIDPGTVKASFWVSGCATFSAKKTFGYLAAQLAEARATKDPQREQAVLNIDFGEIFQRRGDAPDWQVVHALADPGYVLGFVTAAVTTLTAGVDVSANRLIWGVRGWAPESDLTSWLIARGELWGDTDQPAVWERLAQEVLGASWDGLSVSLMAVDSGYRPEDVYAFCQKYTGQAVATKGRNLMDRPWYAAPVEVNWRGKAKPHGMYLWHLNTDVLKSWVHARVRRPIDQPGAWHLPRDIDDEYCKQIVAESRVVDLDGRPRWLKQRANHFLDVESLCYFAVCQVTVYAERPAGDNGDLAKQFKVM